MFRMLSRFSILSVLAAAAFSQSAIAQREPQLLADLNQNLASYSCSSTVTRGLTQTAVSLGRSFFSCNSIETGSELWVSDGTQGGTYMVKDINPGAASGSPALFFGLNGTATPLVFFIANSPDYGVELWRTDGTVEGTTLVADIAPGGASSVPRILGGFADQAVIFSADNGASGRELYYADRTGYRSLGDLYPGAGGSISASATGVYLPPSGQFYFAAIEPTYGTELFKTDGFSISLATNIRSGSASSSPANLTLSPIGTAIYFTANNGTSGTELWYTSGSVTTQVADLNAGAASSNPTNFVVTEPPLSSDRRIVFSASNSATGDRLYFLNPSTGGVGAVAEVVAGPEGDRITTTVASGSNVFFQAISPTTGRELYSYNTLTGALNLTGDFTPGVGSSVLSEFAPIGAGSLLVRAYNPQSTDDEYYVTNGSPNSLSLLRDINPGSLGSSIVYLGGAGSSKIFQALSGNDTNLWRTDGSFGGTFAFKDLSVGSGTKSSSPYFKMVLGDKLLHDAVSSAVGSEPQAFSLSSNSNTVLKDIALGSSQSSFPGPFIPFGSKAIFSGISFSVGYEPYITDGTPEGTSLLGDFCSDQTALTPPSLLVVNDKIVVLSLDPLAPFGYSVFVSNGVPGSFVKITGVGGLYPDLSAISTPPVSIGNTVYFSAGDVTTGAELYKLDLNNNSVTLLADFFAGATSSSPGTLTAIDNKVYFEVTIPSPVGRELGVSDGTPGGTFLLADIAQSPGMSSSPEDFIKLGTKVVFSAITPTQGRELYITDGTPGNFQLIKDINPGATSGVNTLTDRTVIVGDVLYFAGVDAEHGVELWRTDGTAAGTYLVKDINPGLASSSPNYLLAIDGYIYFSAISAEFGAELWRSDGTEAGTVQMQDFAPGLQSSSPFRPLAVGGTLLLGLNNGVTGNELYSWAVDECLGSPKFSPGVCGCGVSDADANSNGIFDCLQGEELKALLVLVNGDLKALSSKKLKVNKRKKALKSLKNNLAAATTYGNTWSAGISVSSTKSLNSLLITLNKSVKSLSKSFSRTKLTATKKAFNKLNSAIL